MGRGSSDGRKRGKTVRIPLFPEPHLGAPADIRGYGRSPAGSRFQSLVARLNADTPYHELVFAYGPDASLWAVEIGTGASFAIRTDSASRNRTDLARACLHCSDQRPCLHQQLYWELFLGEAALWPEATGVFQPLRTPEDHTPGLRAISLLPEDAWPADVLVATLDLERAHVGSVGSFLGDASLDAARCSVCSPVRAVVDSDCLHRRIVTGLGGTAFVRDHLREQEHALTLGLAHPNGLAKVGTDLAVETVTRAGGTIGLTVRVYPHDGLALPGQATLETHEVTTSRACLTCPDPVCFGVELLVRVGWV